MSGGASHGRGSASGRPPGAAWHFGRWTVVPRTRQLLLDGQPVKVSGRAFDVLLALIEHGGQVAGKQELLDRVWPGVVVEENNLHLHISALRKVLGHDAIGTVPSRGYRLTMEPDDAAPTPTAPATLLPVPSNTHRSGDLPLGLPPLFGRDAELAALRALISEHRVVTVVGSGGVGKTRLALEAARAWQARHVTPVCLVELAGIAAGTGIAETVARALGAQLPGHQTADDELIDLLRHRELLLLLDNCEHRLAEAAALVERVLRHSERVHVLVTSQASLRTSSEQLFALAPLGVPAAGSTSAQAQRYGAVSLFCARVAALQGQFTLAADNVGDVIDICRRLEGLPLAIELAAARGPLLGLQGLRERLSSVDDSRLGLLAGGSRSTLPRHQTLRDAIGWSYNLLDTDQRRAFRRLGIFAGSFTLDAAWEVLAEGPDERPALLDVLGSLVDRSLLLVLPGQPPHYRLLDSTSAFAVERLKAEGEWADVQRRRALTVLRHFERTPQERWALIPRRRIEAALAELDNLRAALDWLGSEPGEAELHVELAGASAWIWPRVALRLEGARRCRQALARVTLRTPPELEARLQLGAARQAHRRAAPEDMRAVQRAVALYRQLGDKLELFQSLSVQAIMLSLVGDRAQGEAALAEMQANFEPTWPTWLWGPRNWATGLCLGQWGRMEECSAVTDQGLRLARAVGEHAPLALAMLARAQCDSWMGRPESAVRHAREGIAMSRMDGSRGRLGTLLGDLSANLVELGQLDEAEEAAREAVRLRALNGTLWLQLDQLAALALARGHVREAAMAVGRADRCYGWSGGRRHTYLQPLHARVMAELARRLDADELAGLRAHGATLSDEDAAWLALGGPPSSRDWGSPGDLLSDAD